MAGIKASNRMIDHHDRAALHAVDYALNVRTARRTVHCVESVTGAGV